MIVRIDVFQLPVEHTPADPCANGAEFTTSSASAGKSPDVATSSDPQAATTSKPVRKVAPCNRERGRDGAEHVVPQRFTGAVCNRVDFLREEG